VFYAWLTSGNIFNCLLLYTYVYKPFYLDAHAVTMYSTGFTVGVGG